MSTVQRVIKYLALAFGIFIIITIVSAIVFGLQGFASVIGLRDEKNNIRTENVEKLVSNIDISNIKTLKIDIAYTNLKVKTGEVFNIESNSKNFSHKQTNGTLTIKEKTRRVFFNEDISDLIITIPEDKIFDIVNIETGAGEVNIESLSTKRLDFDIGAGKVQIDKLIVTENAKINGGAGKVDVLSGEIKNLDLDMGAGKFTVTSKLTGRNDIDQGAGRLEINFEDSIENYSIKVSKGIGSIMIDGKEVKDETIYGNGDTYIKVDGGIGAIEIKEKQKVGD